MAIGNYGNQIVLTAPDTFDIEARRGFRRKATNTSEPYIFVYGSETAPDGTYHHVSLHLTREQAVQAIAELHYAIAAYDTMKQAQ